MFALYDAIGANPLIDSLAAPDDCQVAAKTALLLLDGQMKHAPVVERAPDRERVVGVLDQGGRPRRVLADERERPQDQAADALAVRRAHKFQLPGLVIEKAPQQTPKQLAQLLVQPRLIAFDLGVYVHRRCVPTRPFSSVEEILLYVAVADVGAAALRARYARTNLDHEDPLLCFAPFLA